MIETEGRIWAVRHEFTDVLRSIHGHVGSDALQAAFEARRLGGSSDEPKKSPSNGVAVIPLQGLITPGLSLMALLFGGGGGLEEFSGQLAQAVGDPAVHAIVLNVDSPGGTVDQVPETAAKIRQAREIKPVVAVANTVAASAAYWLASQANELVVTPSGEAGSIGVYQLHRDMSVAMAQNGVKPTLTSAGKYKVEGNPYEPLSESAAAASQQAVDDFYAMFVKDVALGRGVSPDDVAAGYGEGRLVLASRAIRMGLVDRVATLDATVARLATGRAKVRRYGATAVDSEDLLSAPEYSGEEKCRMFDLLASLR